MEAIDSVILDPLEDMFNSMGAMQGDLAPVKRAAIGAALGYGIAYILKPAVAFNSDGTERPFAFGSEDKKNTTWFPAWMIVAIPAVAFSVLI